MRDGPSKFPLARRARQPRRARCPCANVPDTLARFDSNPMLAARVRTMSHCVSPTRPFSPGEIVSVMASPLPFRSNDARFKRTQPLSSLARISDYLCWLAQPGLHYNDLKFINLHLILFAFFHVLSSKKLVIPPFGFPLTSEFCILFSRPILTFFLR